VALGHPTEIIPATPGSLEDQRENFLRSNPETLERLREDTICRTPAPRADHAIANSTTITSSPDAT